MNKEFVPYEQALQLKKLGFDEPCLGYYGCHQAFFWITKTEGYYDGGLDSVVPAPFYRQAFRWFREKYGLFVQPNRTVDIEGVWYYFLIDTKRMDVCGGSFSYEEAELECLKKCIKNALMKM